MNKLLVLLFCLIMFGCEPISLTQKKAEYICHDKGGVNDITLIAIEDKRIICWDGSVHSPRNVIIPKEYLDTYPPGK